MSDTVYGCLTDGCSERLKGICPEPSFCSVCGQDLSPLSAHDEDLVVYSARVRELEVERDAARDQWGKWQDRAEGAEAERDARQKAIDSALSWMRDSAYVGGPTERATWRHVLRVLSPFETQHQGSALRSPSPSTDEDKP